MSIETNIANFAKAQARTADALEAILQLLSQGQVSIDPESSALHAGAHGNTSTLTQEVPSPEPSSAPEVPEVPEVPTITVDSPEEVNRLLVEEYTRLGAKPEVMQRILALMNDTYGVRSVTDLTKEQYAPLIVAVRALK